MRVRNPVFEVVDYQAQMKCVSRTPDSALTVGKSFHSVLQFLSSCVEPAQGVFRSVGDFQIGFCASLTCGNNERSAFQFHSCRTLLVSLCCPDLAELEVICLDFSAGYG